jgi:hypothetical protein
MHHHTDRGGPRVAAIASMDAANATPQHPQIGQKAFVGYFISCTFIALFSNGAAVSAPKFRGSSSAQHREACADEHPPEESSHTRIA